MYLCCSPFQAWILLRQPLWLAFILGAKPNASNFHFCLLKAPQRRLAGDLGHWAFGPSSSPFLCVGQKEEGSALPSPAHSRPQSASQYTPTCSIPQKSFQVLFERGKKQKGKNQRLYSSRRSIAWHQPLSVPMTPLSCSLLCLECFSQFLFFFFFF